MTLKLAIKRSIASFYQKSGLFRRRCEHSQAFTLMYHRILSCGVNGNFVQPGMYVNADTLESHLEVLKERFTLLSLPDLINRIADGQSIIGCCALTFDDGWRDNYTEAYPLLYKYKVPATIFLTTGYIGTYRQFWPEEVTYYLRQIDNVHGPDHNLLKRLAAEMAKKEMNDHFYDQAVEILKSWQPVDREELLIELRKNCLAPSPERLMINWAEVKEMHQSGLITFGAHTVNHAILDQVSLAEAEREIVQSHDDIKKHLGVAPELFAYPNGNYTPEIQELLKKHGFKAAFTTIKRQVESDVDVFEIPRIGMHEDVSNTQPMFLARIISKGF